MIKAPKASSYVLRKLFHVQFTIIYDYCLFLAGHLIPYKLFNIFFKFLYNNNYINLINIRRRDVVTAPAEWKHKCTKLQVNTQKKTVISASTPYLKYASYKLCEIYKSHKNLNQFPLHLKHKRNIYSFIHNQIELRMHILILF